MLFERKTDACYDNHMEQKLCGKNEEAYKVDASYQYALKQWFSTFVRPRPGISFFYKTRARYNRC
jgi:hypothetical protein